MIIFLMNSILYIPLLLMIIFPSAINLMQSKANTVLKFLAAIESFDYQEPDLSDFTILIRLLCNFQIERDEGAQINKLVFCPLQKSER